MVVCVCLGIRKSELQEILKISEGANLEMVQKSCGAGTDCGACVDRLKQILETKPASQFQSQSE
jgi:bacterioferritin-associated ferredoxin